MAWVWGANWITNPPHCFPQRSDLDFGPSQFGSTKIHAMILVSQWIGNYFYIGELRGGTENIGLRETPSSQVVRSKQDGTHKCLTQNLEPQGIAVFRYLKPMVAAIETLFAFFSLKSVILYQPVKGRIFFIFI